MLGAGGHRCRVLNEHRRVGHDVVDRLAVLLGGDRLVLVRQHHVALTADERLQRLAGALGLHRHVAEERAQVGHRFIADRPCRTWAPYAARMFQRAPPDVNGFGVITSMPGCNRSDQSWIARGLPMRTTSATTELVTMPRA